MSKPHDQPFKHLYTLLLWFFVLCAPNIANSQTDWSKVKINYTNQCNVFSFEITGTSDTCFTTHSTEFVDKWADPVYRTLAKKFTAVFADTGLYYGTIQIRNKCQQDDTTIYLTVNVKCKPEKCKWFGAKLKQYNQNRYYQWQLENIYPDSCLNYQYRFYNFQTGKTDTGKHYNGLCNYTFPSAGKFKMTLSIKNQCKNCDTIFSKEIIILAFQNAKLQPLLFRCDSLNAWMNLLATDPKDSCWKHYFRIYSDPSLDTISANRWNNPSDASIYTKYKFLDSHLLVSTNNGRFISYRFPQKGRYILAAQWSHLCYSQDTIIYSRFEIPDCYAGLTNHLQSKQAMEIVQMCNAMGQNIPLGSEIPKNQLILFRFKNGASKKVIIRE
jgi:hypothetical protein